MKVYEAWTEKSCESKYYLSVADAENYLIREYIKQFGFDCNEEFAQDIKAIVEDHELDCFGAIFEIEVE